MIVVRRLYVLLVSAISMQAVAWSLIALLRGLLTPGTEHPKTAVAFEIAVILVGLPLFAAHWLWAQRLAARDEEERTSTLRRLYLFGMMAGFLGPLVANGYAVLHIAFSQMLDVTLPRYIYAVQTLQTAVVYYPVAMVVLALFLGAKQLLLRQDRRRQVAAESTGQATVRRLYVFAFSSVGLAFTAVALVTLLRWVLNQIGSPPADGQVEADQLAAELARLLTGLPLWLVFWLWAQRLFAGGAETELASTLRKFYLYAAVFSSIVTVVASATTTLASIFAVWLDVPFNGDFRQPLAPVIILGPVWAYHARQLNLDARRSAEQPQQAGIRRLYLYLVAGVGLLALLIGIGGIVGVSFFVLDGEPFAGDLREGLSWFAAAIIAGLFVWLLPWRQIRGAAAQTGVVGQAERQSLVRKIYLYLYVFLATLTVLGTAIFIVAELVELLLAARDTMHLLRDLGMALAYGLIGVGIWVYHGTTLRTDGRIAEQARRAELAEVRVALFGGEQPEIMQRLRHTLQQALPELNVQLVPPVAAPDPGTASVAAEAGVEPLDDADIIIMPAPLAMHNGQAALAEAVIRSPVRKLLLPVGTEDCIWLGMEEQDFDDLGKKAVQAIEQIAAGEAVQPGRKLGAGTIIAMIIAGLVLLALLVPLVITLIDEFFM